MPRMHQAGYYVVMKREKRISRAAYHVQYTFTFSVSLPRNVAFGPASSMPMVVHRANGHEQEATSRTHDATDDATPQSLVGMPLGPDRPDRPDPPQTCLTLKSTPLTDD